MHSRRRFLATTAATASAALAAGPTSGAQTAAERATASFRSGPVDRDNNGVVADGGIIATIDDYAGAATVRISYRLPEQDATLYESARFAVADVREAGSLAKGQQDPDRRANELMASDIERRSDGQSREFGIYQDEHVVLQFYDDGGDVIDEITYVVGRGKQRNLDTGTATTESGAAESTPRRGFFSNGGDSPEALSSVFNLTVLGFLLSVGGIVYQMLAGQ